MRRAPHLRFAIRFPTTSFVALVACSVSVLWWTGYDISSVFLEAGAWRGEPWRFVLSAFPHVNIIHLGFNLYWLWVFGTAVEAVYGSLRSAALLLILSVSAAAAEYAIFEGGVGLSGAVYGLFGFVWWLSQRESRFAGTVDRTTAQVFIVWFMLCIILTYTRVMPVANVAHAVGWGMGTLIGVAVCATGLRRRALIATACGAAIVTLVAATVARPWVNISADRGWEAGARGYEALVARDYRQARIWLERALALNPAEASYWHNLGLALQSLDEYVQAAEAYRRALALDPSLESRAALSALNARLAYDAAIAGNHEEVIRLSRESIALNDADSYAWYSLARALFMIGEAAEACQAARKAAALNPSDLTFEEGTRVFCDASAVKESSDE